MNIQILNILTCETIAFKFIVFDKLYTMAKYYGSFFSTVQETFYFYMLIDTT